MKFFATVRQGGPKKSNANAEAHASESVLFESNWDAFVEISANSIAEYLALEIQAILTENS